eukprot:14850260-Alexandrium_andersonii.AAC.1
MLEIHDRVLQSVRPAARHEVVAEVAAYRHSSGPEPPAKAAPPHLRDAADPAPASQSASTSGPPNKPLP